jgi:hypothetical protein
VPRDHDYLGVDTLRLQARERLQAVDSGQPHVEQQGVERPLGRRGDTFFAAADGGDAVPFVLQDRRQHRANARLVVDDENRLMRHRALRFAGP